MPNVEGGPASPRNLLIYDVVMDYRFSMKQLHRDRRVEHAVVLRPHAFGREQCNHGPYPLPALEGVLQGTEEAGAGIPLNSRSTAMLVRSRYSLVFSVISSRNVGSLSTKNWNLFDTTLCSCYLTVVEAASCLVNPRSLLARRHSYLSRWTSCSVVALHSASDSSGGP